MSIEIKKCNCSCDKGIDGLDLKTNAGVECLDLVKLLLAFDADNELIRTAILRYYFPNDN